MNIQTIVLLDLESTSLRESARPSDSEIALRISTSVLCKLFSPPLYRKSLNLFLRCQCGWFSSGSSENGQLPEERKKSFSVTKV